MTQGELIQQFNSIVGSKRVLTKSTKTAYYRSGFRSGKGAALAVVFPSTILEQWKLIEECVKYNCIVIMLLYGVYFRVYVATRGRRG